MSGSMVDFKVNSLRPEGVKKSVLTMLWLTRVLSRNINVDVLVVDIVRYET